MTWDTWINDLRTAVAASLSTPAAERDISTLVREWDNFGEAISRRAPADTLVDALDETLAATKREVPGVNSVEAELGRARGRAAEFIGTTYAREGDYERAREFYSDALHVATGAKPWDLPNRRAVLGRPPKTRMIARRQARFPEFATPIAVRLSAALDGGFYPGTHKFIPRYNIETKLALIHQSLELLRPRGDQLLPPAYFYYQLDDAVKQDLARSTRKRMFDLAESLGEGRTPAIQVTLSAELAKLGAQEHGDGPTLSSAYEGLGGAEPFMRLALNTAIVTGTGTVLAEHGAALSRGQMEDTFVHLRSMGDEITPMFDGPAHERKVSLMCFEFEESFVAEASPTGPFAETRAALVERLDVFCDRLEDPRVPLGTGSVASVATELRTLTGANQVVAAAFAAAVQAQLDLERVATVRLAAATGVRARINATLDLGRAQYLSGKLLRQMATELGPQMPLKAREQLSSLAMAHMTSAKQSYSKVAQVEAIGKSKHPDKNIGRNGLEACEIQLTQMHRESVGI